MISAPTRSGSSPTPHERPGARVPGGFMRIRFTRWGLALLVLAVACGQQEAPSPPAAKPAATTASPPAPAPAPPAAPAASSAAATDETLQIFATRCATCHGSEGAGNGPGAAALDPKPRNFQDAAWQGTVTDEHLEKIIQ